MGQGGVRTGATVLVCFAVSCAVGLHSWATATVGGFDLGIFDQGIRSYAHLHLPYSTLKSVHHGFPPGFSLLGDHFSPVLALLAPLYRLWNDPRVLILAQAALFAAGAVPLRRIAASCLAVCPEATRRRATDLAGAVYALGWPLLTASRVGFHEVAFAVPLLLWMMERARARRFGWVLGCALLLCCTKEDLGLAVGGYGAALLLRERDDADRRALLTGGALLLGGPLLSVLEIKVLIPGMGGQAGYYWSYGALGGDLTAVAARAASDPLALLGTAVTPGLKLALLAWLLGTLALLPLGSATVLAAVPLLAERLLSADRSYWTATHHYDAFLWPILLTASLETLERLLAEPGRRRRLGAALGLAASVVCLGAAVPFGLTSLMPGAWRPSPTARALIDAAAQVPAGVTVEAANNAAPRLTARDTVYLLDGTPRGADYVLLSTAKPDFPFTGADQERARVRLLLAHGYVRQWSRDGVVLLRRVRREPVPGMALPGPHSTPVKDPLPPDVGRNLFTG